MEEIIKLLGEKQNQLQIILGEARRQKANAPEGKLRASIREGRTQYYIRTEAKDTRGKYIRKSNQKLIHQLAQKEYATKVLAQIEVQLHTIERFLSNYNEKDIKQIYEEMHPAKQSMINPYILTDEQFVTEWEKTNERRCNKEKEEKMLIKLENEEDGIYTEKGELVRSKSEKILADKLYMMGIPYCYERPLHLNGFGIVYPDFTVLNKRTRKEYFWEHLGRMDMEDYLAKTIRKIECYTNNDIYQGEKLILTYETQNHPLNTKIVDRLIRKYLL